MISDAANMMQVESHVLRYWEEELELDVPRNEMGHRYYTEENMQQFRQIKKWKEEGYQLKAIKMMLHNENPNLEEAKQQEHTTAMSGETESEPEKDGQQMHVAVSHTNAAPAGLTKLEQFQLMMNDIVRNAIAENNQALGQAVSEHVGEKVIKEMNYLMQEQEEQEEERFRKLDEAIRSRQMSRKEKKQKEIQQKAEQELLLKDMQSPLEQGLIMEALDQPDNFPQVFKKYQGLLSFPEKGLYACICSFVEETYLKSFLKDIVRILLSCGAESVFSVIYVKNSALFVLSSPTLAHQETIRQSLEELHYPQQCVTFEVSFLHGDTSEDLFAQIISKIARYDRILLIRPETGETREFHNNMAAPWRISRLREAFTASPAETDIPSLLDSVFTPSMTPDVAKNIALGLFLNPDNSGQEPPLDIACDFFRRLYSCTQTSEIRKLAEIVLLQEKDEAASSKGGANISLLKSYVEAHLDCETLSLKWLAENYLFVSVGYLSKQFVKEEGIRFSDYLNKKRMEQAIRLMVYYHNDNIKTIARSVGFGNNPQYFSQVFKKYTGYTPTEYIEREGASASS